MNGMNEWMKSGNAWERVENEWKLNVESEKNVARWEKWQKTEHVWVAHWCCHSSSVLDKDEAVNFSNVIN